MKEEVLKVITVRIGREKRDLRELHEQWVNQEIRSLRRTNEPVCVQVSIQEGYLNMVLSTPDCPKSASGGRPPNEKEREIFDLWDLMGLHSDDFTGGNLIAFLNRLKNIL